MRRFASPRLCCEQIAYTVNSDNRAVKQYRVIAYHLFRYLTVNRQFFQIAVRKMPCRDALNSIFTGRFLTLIVNICLRSSHGIIGRSVRQIVGAIFMNFLIYGANLDYLISDFIPIYHTFSQPLFFYQPIPAEQQHTTALPYYAHRVQQRTYRRKLDGLCHLLSRNENAMYPK